MTSVAIFFLLYLAIYLCGCSAVTKQDASVLRITVFGATRPSPILALPGLKRNIYFSSWLPGTGGIAVCASNPEMRVPGDRFGVLLDTHRAEKLWALYRRQTTLLIFACQLQFVIVFVLSPLVAYAVTPYALVLVFPIWLVLHIVTVWSFAQLTRCKSLRPPDRAEEIAKLVLSPPLALQAGGIILRSLFIRCHSLAVVNATCGEQIARRLSTELLRELEFPTAEEQEIGAAADHDFAAWVAEAKELVESRHGVSGSRSIVTALNAAERYCPRCGTQFTGAVEVCQDCGLRLMSFAAEERARSQAAH